MDTLVRLNGDSSETFSIVKPGKPRNEIANLSTMARVEKKKKSLRAEKSEKFENQIPLKRIMIPSFELHARCSAISNANEHRGSKTIFIFRLEFIVGVFTNKKKKGTTCPIEYSLVTISYHLFSIRQKIIDSVCLPVWHFKILTLLSQEFGLDSSKILRLQSMNRMQKGSLKLREILM